MIGAAQPGALTKHGVQTSTEHLGHVGAEGDEKYVTG